MYRACSQGSAALALVLALDTIVLMGADGKPIELNPANVTAFRAPRLVDNFIAWAKCRIFTNDGRFLSVGETCEQVSEKLHKLKPEEE